MRNILGTVPSASKDMVAATVRTIFAQPSATACRAQLHEVVRILEGQFPKAAAILDNAEPDVLAHTGFPRAHWRKIASTNPLERINKEIPVLRSGSPAEGDGLLMVGDRAGV
jgi:transposase-like protein